MVAHLQRLDVPVSLNRTRRAREREGCHLGLLIRTSLLSGVGYLSGKFVLSFIPTALREHGMKGMMQDRNFVTIILSLIGQHCPDASPWHVQWMW